MQLRAASVDYSIGLVHELPHLIRVFDWTHDVAALIQGTDALVFACPQVQASFTGAFACMDKPTYIYPQSFNLDPGQLAPEQRAHSRLGFRARLGLTDDDVLILGCGDSDFRKGIDLFVQAAREIALSSTLSTIRRIVFAWAGQVSSNLRAWADKDAIELGLSDRLIFLGTQRDMAPCFAGADLFFLPSREDPFPTVVLEAMAYGLPVVGFAQSGGVEEQVKGGVGVIVPYGDVTAAVTVLRRLAERPDDRARMGRLGQEKIAISDDYHTYVGNLQNLFSSSTSLGV